tara:strand:- start:225 stop:374 length:150 start_codon:yes stop_codon:yes gene_type:complete
MTEETLEQLFFKYDVPTNISFLAKVQTLLSKHNCKYDKIIKMYNEINDK